MNVYIGLESPSVQLSHSSVTHIVPGENDTVITCTGTGKPSPLVEFGGLICSKEITGIIMSHDLHCKLYVLH